MSAITISVSANIVNCLRYKVNSNTELTDSGDGKQDYCITFQTCVTPLLVRTVVHAA